MRERPWGPWRPGREERFDLGTRVVGHRGAAAHAPENTLAGLRKAHELGCRWVEFDVKLSRDGVPVLFHDERLERTTNGHGQVRDHDLASLRQLDAGRWFSPAFAGEPVPTLAEAIDLVVRIDLEANIEIKPCPGRERETAEIVVDEILRTWPGDAPAPLLSSFSPEALEVVRDRAPQLPRGLLLERPIGSWAEQMQRLGCVSLHLSQRHAPPAKIARLRRQAVPVLLYTVNDPGRARELLDAGAVALFSDVPELLLDL